MAKKKQEPKKVSPESFKARLENAKQRAGDSIREEIVLLSLKKKEATSLGFSSLAAKFAGRIDELTNKLEG